MFDSFPKTRLPLTKEYKDIYLKHYISNRNGNTPATGLAQKMEKWLHKKVAGDVSKSHTKKTLEIGAGSLNQLQYEVSDFYDIIEPFSELYSNSPDLNKINTIYKDINEIELFEKYDRITSVATFEHITDLPKVVAKTCLLLNTNGSLRTSIPNEGTLLWTLGWKLTTGLEFKLKHGLNYGTLMRHEHVNNAKEIDEVLNYFYDTNKCKIFGLNKKFGFYRFYESKNPNISRAKAYLKDYHSEA